MTFTYTGECCIRATDIVEISSWVMKGGQSTDVTLRTVWPKTDKTEESWVAYQMHGSRCIEFHESYDSELQDILLTFNFEAENVTRTDSSEADVTSSLQNRLT